MFSAGGLSIGFNERVHQARYKGAVVAIKYLNLPKPPELTRSLLLELKRVKYIKYIFL